MFDLINKLCNPEVYDHDTVIAEAENSISIIANIDDFEFTDSTEAGQGKREKTGLDVLLSFNPNASK